MLDIFNPDPNSKETDWFFEACFWSNEILNSMLVDNLNSWNF